MTINLTLTAVALATLIMLGTTAAHAAEPMLEKTDLFEGGLGGFTLYRIPGIVVTPKETVLAYCEARRDSPADWGEIEVYLCRSTDGGRTWDRPRQVAHKGPRLEGLPGKTGDAERQQTVNNPVAIAARDGTVHFLYCVNYERAFYMRSDDDGETFGEPVEITPAFEGFRPACAWNVIATGPGHGIELRNGRLVVPVWLAYGGPGRHAPSVAATVYSDDAGRTWRAGDVAVRNEPPVNNPNETCAVELSDGPVMLNVRSPSKASRRLVTISADGATGWSTPTFDDALWEPICAAGLIAIPGQPGSLVFSNPHSLLRDESGAPVPGGQGRRRNLSLKLSRDDGKTWPFNRTLEEGTSAYSDLAALPDGTILCFYERDRRLTIACFNLDWVMGDKPGGS